MWMAWDRFQKTGRGDQISVDFYTGIGGMFGVKKYSDALNELRLQRGVGGFFLHNLVAVDAGNHKATFKKADGSTVDVDYTLLHVSPPMGPLEVVKNSPLADEAGWVSVDKDTLRHTNPEFGNVWALGDCSSLPTSKTAAAITAQAPILTENLFSVVTTGKVLDVQYDGYTSCPVSLHNALRTVEGAPSLTWLVSQLLTGYGQLMLAEFKYGGVPKETFANYLGDQAKPAALYYYLKKDLFPWAYWNYMVRVPLRSIRQGPPAHVRTVGPGPVVWYQWPVAAQVPSNREGSPVSDATRGEVVRAPRITSTLEHSGLSGGIQSNRRCFMYVVYTSVTVVHYTRCPVPGKLLRVWPCQLIGSEAFAIYGLP